MEDRVSGWVRFNGQSIDLQSLWPALSSSELAALVASIVAAIAKISKMASTAELVSKEALVGDVEWNDMLRPVAMERAFIGSEMLPFHG